MNNEILIEQLKGLGLHGMAEALGDLFKLPVQKRPSLEMAAEKLIENEIRSRDAARTARLLKAAKLKMNVLVESVITGADRNFTNEQLTMLADCSFVRRGKNLLLTGLTGSGKTYLACALGHQACTLGLKTLYLNMNRFIEDLTQAQLSGTRQKLVDKLNKNDLIILDDFGLQEMTSVARLSLLTLIDDRYEKKSLIINSQMSLDKWYDYIAEPTMADAIMDRLVNSSHHIELEGDTLRKRCRRMK